MSQAVPDLQEGLVTLLTTALASESIVPRFGLPLEVPKHNERVYVITEANYTLGGGEQYREESFAGRFVVEIVKSGDHPAETSRRRWEVIELIDTALYDDDFYGYRTMGLVLSVDSELVAFDTGWIARSTCSIGAHGEV